MNVRFDWVGWSLVALVLIGAWVALRVVIKGGVGY